MSSEACKIIMSYQIDITNKFTSLVHHHAQMKKRILQHRLV